MQHQMLSPIEIYVIFAVCMGSLICGSSAETYDECADVDPDTYVASSESCSSYILCNGDDSEKFECAEGQYFDGENETCDDKENVFCPLDAGGEEGEDVEDGDEAEANNEGEPVEVPTVAPTTSTTPPTPPTAASTTTPAEILDVSPIVKDTCPPTDDSNQIIFVASSNSCSDYYVCYHNHPVEMHCTDHLHFNTLTGKCDFPENSNCKISNQPPSATNKCLPHVTDFFPHPQKCNYFFYCIKGYQTLQQCPFYYGWDIERRTCIHMAQVKCYENTH